MIPCPMDKSQAEYNPPIQNLCNSWRLYKDKPKEPWKDGHCLRRALGKLWDMQPGQVIQKIREGGEHLRLHHGKLVIESDDNWYKDICNRPSEWDNIQHNKNSHCSEKEWGVITT